MGTKQKDMVNPSHSVEMPQYLNIMRFAEARAQEVKKMIGALTETNSTKLIFQQLPKHMRRRVMSHNIKRLPKKHRVIHLNQLKKSGMPIKTKRPSRKYRRKPCNLLSEYNRRQRRIAWMETHIWHAKRFHMIEKWGYKLPFKSCDKTFRTCYLATTKYCLLQDISYYVCIEVNGNQTILIDGFKRMTNQNIGLTVGARAYTNSSREGTTIFYNKDCYPFNAIGEVRFIWKPSSETNRTLWLWVHPSYHLEIVENITQIFDLVETEGNKIKTYRNQGTNISLLILKNHFNRFRLTGPLSSAIISKALKTPDPKNKTGWFDNYLNCDENRQIFSDQCEFWKMLQNVQLPTQISPRVIANLITIDPRYNLPEKRTRALPNTVDNNACHINDSLKFGRIWDCSEYTLVAEYKMSTAQFLKARANMVVADDEPPNTAMVLPIMAIQRPGVSESTNFIGYGSGWDIIVPPGWAIPVWLCLIMWGARTGGLRETESIQYEMGRYDVLPPDTKAGQMEDDDISNKDLEKFFRLPPAKRTNYNKFSICSPFKCQWKKLIRDWKTSKTDVDNFYILRDRKILGNIQEILKSKNYKKSNLLNDIGIDLSEHCLVPVKLTLLNKGKATRYSIICLPEESDLGKKLVAPIESLRADPNQKRRTELRKEHKLYLKRMSRKRGRAKKDGKVLQRPTEQIQEHRKQMQDLWLPEAENIKDSCIRKIIGYVTKGDVSFISGHGQSIGYITVGALGTLIQNSQINKVLLRNTHSRQYRFAKLEVICSNF